MAMGRSNVDLREHGFTLIEVMTALTIFSIGVMSIIGMFIMGEKGIAGGNRSFTAVQTARAQMELLRNSAVQSPTSDVCSTPSTSTIQCVWSVMKDTPEEGLSTLQVITTWYEGDKERQLVLTSLRFDGNN